MSIISTSIDGYKWNTIEDFNASLSSVNESMSFPLGEEDITTTAMEALENYDVDGITLLFYYVGEHEQLVSLLGAPTTFNINIEVADPD